MKYLGIQGATHGEFMNCPSCNAENLTDYVVCPTCATTCHFEYRKNCRCADCSNARDLAEMPERLRERLQGSVLLASSEDGADVVRFPFSIDALKPECRLEVARAISDLVKSVAKAA